MIPNVKIGAVNYEVKEVDDLHTIGNKGKKHAMHGLITWTNATIELKTGQAHDVTVSVLWHEIVHGILVHAGHNAHDEQLVCALGYGLMQVVRDNPELIAYTVNPPE